MTNRTFSPFDEVVYTLNMSEWDLALHRLLFSEHLVATLGVVFQLL